MFLKTVPDRSATRPETRSSEARLPCPPKPSYSFTISTSRSVNLIKLFRMQMVEAFAEFERAILRERTRTGLDAARKEGRTGGRRSKLRTNQQDEIVTMVSAGTKTAADAARLLNVHPAMVSRLLARAGARRLPSVGSAHISGNSATLAVDWRHCIQGANECYEKLTVS
jgi:Resolvase, N terminal domain